MSNKYSNNNLINQIVLNEDKLTDELESLSSKEKAEIFKEKLKLFGINHLWKFDDVKQTMKKEPIWKAIKTYNEKKNIFNEYISDYRSKVKEEFLLKKEKLRNKFRQLLEEDLTLNSNSTYTEALKKFCYDDRWRAIEEKERIDLFEDYIDILYEQEEEENKKKREKNKKLFYDKLIEKNIKSNTKWLDINIMFQNDELFKSMEKLDKIEVFSEYIKKLRDEEKKIEEENNRYKEFQNREKFKDLLQIYLEKREINMKTKWKEFVKKIIDKEEYLNLIGQKGSTPHDFFTDIISQLKKDYKENKMIFKTILKENNIKFNSNINYQEYNKILNKYKEYDKIKENIKPILYEHLIKKIKEKEMEHNKREEKIAKKLISYIERKKLNISYNITFEDALPLIRQHQKFKPITDENLKCAFELMKKKKNY